MCLTVLTFADGQVEEVAGVHHLREPLIDHSEGQLFLNEAFKIIVEEVLRKGTDVNQKVRRETHNPNSLKRSHVSLYGTECSFPPPQVCEWKEPQELAQLLDLELRETGEPQHRLLQRVKDVAKYSVKTSEAMDR